MVKKLSRRDALKLGAIGLGGGLLALSPIGQFKKKKENNMTIHIHGTSNAGYNTGVDNAGIQYADITETAGKFPGMVVGISIFGSESVVSVKDEESRDYTFVRADVTGSIRSEIWYLLNLFPVAEPQISVLLTGATDFVVGACCYNYFGGVGSTGGDTGTTAPTTQASIEGVKIDSIVFCNLSINAVGGSAGSSLNDRWEISGGTNNHGLGADLGPVDYEGSFSPTFLNNGVGDIWALSLAELRPYQSNPPAIMGL